MNSIESEMRWIPEDDFGIVENNKNQRLVKRIRMRTCS